MRLTLTHGACAAGLTCLVLSACSKTHDHEVKSRPDEPSAAEQRRIDERRAEERRAEERKAERRAEERRAEERREEERRAEQRRADERRDERKPVLASSVDKVRATPSSALTSLATERCDREARCKNIGAKEKYHTRAECVTEMQRDKRDDLNSDVCPGGVHQKELGDCLQAIREESCNSPLDSLTRLTACRAGNLCAK